MTKKVKGYLGPEDMGREVGKGEEMTSLFGIFSFLKGGR